MSYMEGIQTRLRGLPLIALLFCTLTLFAPSRASAVGSVTLLWNPSPSTNVTGYFVYYGVQSATYTNKIDAGSATNATISGLVDGATYYFAVTAYTSAGLESDFSNEMSYTVPTSGNQPPTLNVIGNITINEDAAAQTVNLSGITSGSSNEVQTLTVTATSSNPGLIPNPSVTYTSPNATGNLTFAPVPTANGTATITVTVNDGQPANNTITRTFTLTVTPVNDPPTLNTLANLTILESSGVQTVALSGISSGVTNEVQTVTVTATSSNPGLIPNPTVTYTSPNVSGSLTFTPALTSNGTATITVTVNDGQTLNNTVTRTFTVTVTPVNDPPTLNALANLAINANAGLQTVALSGLSSGAANETQTLTVTATSSNPGLIPNPTVTYTSPNATGTLRFTPAANSTGSATVTVTVNDGQALNNTVTRTFTVSVNPFNTQPTLNTLANLTFNEDASTQTVNLLGITSGATNEVQTLTVSATSSNPGLIPNPTVNYTSPNTTGTLTFAPLPDANGAATITVTVDDGQALNNTITRTFTVTVNAVNDPPTLNALANLTINEDAGLQSVNLLGIGSGAANETQTLTVTATSSNPGLIPNPTVTYSSPSATGSLSFAPAANANGTATITVTVNDGQALNNTVTRTFTVTVTPVNDAPTLNPIANISINENAGLQTVALSGITSGAANEAQTLTVTATSSNPGLIPNPTVAYTSPNVTGSVSFTPAANVSGTATITITVNDGQAQNNTVSSTFLVTVNSVNNQPTLNAIANVTLNPNAGVQTVALSGITSGTNEVQTLTVTATSGNPALIQNPTVNYASPNTTGSLTFTPAANVSGTATITVTVDDGQPLNNTITRTFVVTINAPSNNTPTLDPIASVTINEDAGAQTVPLSGITSGSINEAQTLTISAISSNPGIIPNPTVAYASPDPTGSLTFTPVANANGTVTITVTVNDGQAQNNTVTRTFTVTVNPVNDSPTLNVLPNIAVNVNAGIQTVALSGITPGAANENQTLTVTATSSNPGVVPNPNVNYSSPNPIGNLTFTPVANLSGNAVITVTVNDGQTQNNTIARTFTVTVNSPPSISTIADQSNAVNTVFGPIPFTIGDIETPSANLTLSATSSNPGVIPEANIVFGGAGSSRTVTLTPVTDQAGIADINIAVNDGVTSNTTSFQVFVQPPRPSAPTLLVVTNGAGKVSGMPSKLVVGQKYTLTATPAANQLFAGWSGTFSSTNPKLTFVASSNMVLQANFVTNLFIPVSGAYNGLFYEAGAVHQTSSGFFSASSTTLGTYSGRVQIGARRYSFSGKFDLQGNASNSVVRPLTTPLAVHLHLGTADQADQITGTVSDGSWVADISAARSTFNSRLKPAPFAGTYTVVLPGEDGATDKPAGSGFGTVSVSTSGAARLAGSLADGTKISQSAFLSKGGQWPLYTSLYAGNGSVISWLAFSNQPDSDMAGLLNWIKPANASRFYYPAGFTNQLAASGSTYRRPIISTNSVLHLASGQIQFTGGDLPTNFANLISLGVSSRVSNHSTNALTLSFSVGNGTFSGTVTHPTSGKRLRFGGAAYQKLNTGYGFMLGTNLSSSVIVE